MSEVLLIPYYRGRTPQVALVVKNLPISAGDPRDVGLIPGLGTSPGVGSGNALQCSCLENPMDRGAWWATVHGVTKNHTWLSGHYRWRNRIRKLRNLFNCSKHLLSSDDSLLWNRHTLIPSVSPKLFLMEKFKLRINWEKVEETSVYP